MSAKSCSVDGCERPYYAKGFCNLHWRRNRDHGSPFGGRPHRWERGVRWEYYKNVVLTWTSDECLNRPFGLNPSGYGCIGSALMHRMACQDIHGPAPTPKHEVAHWCGNRRCVNPKHLRWATRAENVKDMERHGTRLIGEAHPMNRLTRQQVLEMRSRLDMPRDQMARHYGISRSHVDRILRKEQWAWLD